MYRFEHPEYLHTLWVVPLLILAFVVYKAWQKKAQSLWGDAALLTEMAQFRSAGKPWLKLIYLCLAVVFMAFGLANPQVGTKTETIKRKGIDMVFALDVSKSMLAEDVAPSRLEKAKHIISQTIDQLSGDRIGIIAYAGNAYPLLPITTDYAAAKLAINSASPDFLPKQGTALDKALEYSLTYFDPASPASKVLVIVSDGEDHEENWEEQISALKEQGIMVLCVGMGTSKGGPIPEKTGQQLLGYKKDRNNEIVITRLDPSALREIANRTDGDYMLGSNVNAVVTKITNATSGLNKAEIEEKVFTDYEDQFQWFIGAALVLLLLDLLTAERKSTWLLRWGLNSENEK